VISGSFSSFDRRPLEGPKTELQLDHVASTSAHQQVVAELDGSNLSTSHSGEVGRDPDAALNIGGSSGTNWNDVPNNGVDEPDEPLWEWEQLNWI
jgi:hypothetical protein